MPNVFKSDVTATTGFMQMEDRIYDLLCAIVEQACKDYRNLVRLGYVDNGHLTKKGQGITDTTAKVCMTSHEMLDLIAFFYSPEFEQLCEEVLRIPIDPVAVRNRLGMPSSKPIQVDPNRAA